MKVLVTQSCLTLCNPMDCSPPGSSVHGILQAGILEWVAISSSRGSSQPRDQTQTFCTADKCFTIWATRGCLSKQWFQWTQNLYLPIHRKSTMSLTRDVWFSLIGSSLFIFDYLFSVIVVWTLMILAPFLSLLSSPSEGVLKGCLLGFSP